jgi:hypothetical protein
MAVERVSGGSTLARVVVASIDTYLKYADAVGLTGLVSRPRLGPGAEAELPPEPVRRASRAPGRRRTARR